MPTTRQSPSARRIAVEIRGAVQGVGFRPFVHRLANSLDLSGFIRNAPHGVSLEIEGCPDRIESFLFQLPLQAPVPSAIETIIPRAVRPTGVRGFHIVGSESAGPPTALIMPDLATCPDCLAEISDPADRRYRYPFTNCTRCGPRFSILESIPYDRPNTSMRRFTMCPACQAEYDDPADRRFHAQPNACPQCGPHLEFRDSRGRPIESRDAALIAAAAAIRAGKIVAIKGIGGFHLFVDARHEGAVRELRRRKHRDEKPLAIMMPDLAAASAYCQISDSEANLLQSSAAPIVLLHARSDADPTRLAPNLAPENPQLGIILPYSPLHHLLLSELQFPVVATSANRSEEPICIDEQEALDRLQGIADGFLVHNRPIVRPVDDSVALIALDRPLLLRRSRGYAPLPVPFADCGEPILALGAQQKNTIALAVDHHVFISQHIGDLESIAAQNAQETAAAHLQQLYHARPAKIACDLHSDYASTQFARRLNSSPVQVQHHHAHIAACMAEHNLDGQVLGICWDGTGYGPDQTIWGGEFLLAERAAFRRIAHLRTFPLPGATQAIREPRRCAIGLLHDTFGPSAMELTGLPPILEFTTSQRAALSRMIERQINSPRTSSAGRLFDAVASILGLRQIASFEGQAAIQLQSTAADPDHSPPYPFVLDTLMSPAQLDWRPLIRALIDDQRSGDPPCRIAARFHASLTEMMLQLARHAALPRVVLSGGCFQNVLLLEGAARRLRSAGFDVYWPQRVPPNDGGISLGQSVVAAARTPCQETPTCA